MRGKKRGSEEVPDQESPIPETVEHPVEAVQEQEVVGMEVSSGAPPVTTGEPPSRSSSSSGWKTLGPPPLTTFGSPKTVPPGDRGR
jgi:hypothetical protein